MAFFMKSLVRFGVIGGLLAGGAALIAGPHRVAALAEQAKDKVVGVIDASIDDPIAMRAQLRELESQYPRRIAEVSSHLSEIQTQIDQIRRDKAVADRVVTLAQADYEGLSDLIARAEAARADFDGAKLVKVAFDDRTMDLPEAYRRAGSIRETVDLYEASVADYERELSNLTADAEQLQGLLAKLENEHAEFQTQLAHLERQIDAVARKEKMVDIYQERQQRFDELSRYKVASLDQFRSTLAKKNAELDAAMASLARRDSQQSYEDVAKVQIDRESSQRSRAALEQTRVVRPETEIIGEQPEEGEADEGEEGVVAWSGTLVID